MLVLIVSGTSRVLAQMRLVTNKFKLQLIYGKFTDMDKTEPLTTNLVVMQFNQAISFC